MDAPALSKADPTARVVAFLSAPDALAASGAKVVGATNEPPYPCVVVSDPPGGDAGLGRHLISTTLLFEVLGSRDETIGRSAVKAVAFATIDLLRTLHEQPYDPDWPVITNVTFSTPGWSPLPTGQPRYTFRATVHSHP